MVLPVLSLRRIAPWIAQRYGWTTSFSFSAVLAVIGAICWMTVHPEHPLDKINLRISFCCGYDGAVML